METITLKVGGMSCMGCVSTVKRLLETLPGVTGVEVDLAGATARIAYDPAQADTAAFHRVLDEAGYPVG